MTSSTSTEAGAAVAAPAGRRRSVVAAPLVLAGLFCVGFLWSVSIGPQDIGLGTLLRGMVNPDRSVPELVVHLIRLPRALLAGLVGANLAVAGVIMQGITNNPLGAPEILGINAGAAIVVALAATIVPGIAGVGLVGLAFAGAAAAAAVVFGLARFGRGGLSPVRLALAGVTISLLLFSMMQGLLIVFSQSTENFFFWLIGGVSYAQWDQVHTVVPWVVVGIVGAFLLASRLNVLALGDDVARGLGQNVTRTRLAGATCVVLLAGAAIGVAGAVGFIGLIVPHIVRKLVGQNHFVVLPVSALFGATLFLYADIVSRYVASSATQLPAGLVTAAIGAPFFIYLARREKVAG